VIWSAGYTIISGALQAWIADEVGERDLGRAYLRSAQAEYLGSLVGVLASALLPTIPLKAPLLPGGALTVALGATLVFLMRERIFSRAPREVRSSWIRMGATASGGVRLVRGRPVLLILLAVAVFFGVSGEGFDRLW
jgi:MFS transporter, DHA3 family, tetracycline resistance protein